jgi:hypothetical protein
MLTKINKVGNTNTYAKGKSLLLSKQQWYYVYTTIVCLAGRVQSNSPRSANNCSYLFSRAQSNPFWKNVYYILDMEAQRKRLLEEECPSAGDTEDPLANFETGIKSFERKPK